MKIGLIGLSNSGKTTIFNALTGADAQVTEYATEKTEPNLAVVDVTDERIDVLSGTYRPGKTVHAALEVMDFPGPGPDRASGEAFSSESMGLIRNVDALALVVRNFSSELMPAQDPPAHIRQMEEDMVLADMMVIENRLDRIARSYERGKRSGELEKEERTLRKVLEHVNSGRPIRDLSLNGE
jgi:ribosome-binding ATPase